MGALGESLGPRLKEALASLPWTDEEMESQADLCRRLATAVLKGRSELAVSLAVAGVADIGEKLG